jgi:hypothetical protein
VASHVTHIRTIYPPICDGRPPPSEREAGGDGTDTGRALWSFDDEAFGARLGVGTADGDSTGLQVDVAALEGRQLAEAERAERREEDQRAAVGRNSVGQAVHLRNGEERPLGVRD